MISVRVSEAVDRMLISALRFRSQPGAGAMTSVFQTVADASDRAAVRVHWSPAFLVVMVVVLAAGRALLVLTAQRH